jgi:crossover junction endodeoxyribonuclease RusA
MTAVSFTVRGTPSPQGSKRAFNHRSTGRVVVVESAGQGLRDWRQDVTGAAALAMSRLPYEAPEPESAAPLCGPVAVSVAFTLKRPASAPARVRYPAVRPDVDKLLRAVLDALTGIVFADDGQVVEVWAAKYFPGTSMAALDWPGARINVRTMGD